MGSSNSTSAPPPGAPNDQQKLLAAPTDKLRDPNYKGELPDSALQNGTKKDRGCTDIFFCLLFIALWVGLVIVASMSLKQGNPNRLAQGYDSDNHGCGLDSGYENYPFVYFAYPMPSTNYSDVTSNLKKVVCVANCPAGKADSVDCHINSKVTTCKESLGSFMVYSTKPFLGKVCVPNDTSILNITQNSLSFGQWQGYFSDIRTTSNIIYACAGIALAIGFIYMFVVRWCAGPLIWMSIIAFVLALGLLGTFFYLKGRDQQTQADSTNDTAVQSKLQSDASYSKIIGYTGWGLCAVAAILTLIFCKRIQLAIAVLKAAGRFVQETLQVVLLPPVMFALFMATFIYFLIIGLYLYSSGTQYHNDQNWTPFSSFQFDNTLKNLIYFHTFGGLWSLAFNIALTEFILASTCCMWYFKESGFNVVCKSGWHAIRYHLGSLSLGSFILAIVWTVRIIFEFVAHQAEKYKATETTIIKWAISCMRCCLDCFERFIRFLNRQAYIQIALTGKNFCESARDAFFLMLRNTARFSIVAGLGELFILIGKAFIVAVTSFIGYIIITRVDKYSTAISSYYAPVACFAIVSYFVAANFMTVYGVGTEAILQCFLIEEELKVTQKK